MSWPVVPLGEVADVNWGDTSVTKKSYTDDGFTAYSATGADGKLPYFDHDREGVVLSAIGARCGKTWFASGKWSTIKNTIRFWSERSDLDNRFLYWLTADPDFWPRRGAAQPFITIGDARSIKIPLPTLEEQKQIAGILDQADALRRLRTRALDKLNTLGQAIFHEMFVKGNQPTGALSDILIETQIGPFGSLLHKSDYVSGGTCLINPMHINGGQIQPDPNFSISNEKLKELRRYILRPFDIIMGRRGEMGRCAVISENDPRLICGTGSMVLRVDRTKTTPEFLAFFLSTDTGRRQLENAASGVTMPNLNTKSLDAVSVPTPSFEKQEAFSKVIYGLEQQAIKSSRLHQKQETLFASLQHRAFRREL